MVSYLYQFGVIYHICCMSFVTLEINNLLSIYFIQLVAKEQVELALSNRQKTRVVHELLRW